MAPSASCPAKAFKGTPTSTPTLTPKAKKQSSPNKAVSKTPAKLSLKRPASASTASASLETPKKKARATFDAASLASSFVLGDLGDLGGRSSSSSSAFECRARHDAAAKGKARILSLSLADGGEHQPVLTVTYRGEAPKVLQDKVRLLSLAQMHEVLRRIAARYSSSRRVSRPPLSTEALAARSPPLWWSLILLALGWSEDQGAAFKVEGPVAIESNVADLLTTLVDAACPEQSDHEG